MADCVVPQEYGTTIAEKRSVGVKICHGLLEKIKYDLNVARKDNEVDMRYLINLDYQSDLAINSMGRRIRTRLYFTSESHLHTVLSVLRFAGNEEQKTLLSENGIAIINSTPELCYLTQIVLRVFEDARRSMDDPQRFRVEILFSPGATATPFHMHEKRRDQDTSRFDTAPLQLISKEGLTCEDVEDFFETAMLAGRSDSDDELNVEEAASLGTAEKAAKPPLVPVKEVVAKSQPTETTKEPAASEVEEIEEDSNGVPVPVDDSEPPRRDSVDRNLAGIPEDVGESEDEEDSIPSEERKLWFGRKHYWNAVAVGSFVLGASCLLMAIGLSGDDARNRRRWSRRY